MCCFGCRKRPAGSGPASEYRLDRRSGLRPLGELFFDDGSDRDGKPRPPCTTMSIMKPTPFDPATDLAPLPFDERHRDMAFRLKRQGSPGSPMWAASSGTGRDRSPWTRLSRTGFISSSTSAISCGFSEQSRAWRKNSSGFPRGTRQGLPPRNSAWTERRSAISGREKRRRSPEKNCCGSMNFFWPPWRRARWKR